MTGNLHRIFYSTVFVLYFWGPMYFEFVMIKGRTRVGPVVIVPQFLFFPWLLWEIRLIVSSRPSDHSFCGELMLCFWLTICLRFGGFRVSSLRCTSIYESPGDIGHTGSRIFHGKFPSLSTRLLFTYATEFRGFDKGTNLNFQVLTSISSCYKKKCIPWSFLSTPTAVAIWISHSWKQLY